MNALRYLALFILLIPNLVVANLLVPLEEKSNQLLVKQSLTSFWKNGSVLVDSKWVKTSSLKTSKKNKKKTLLSKEQSNIILNLGYLHANAVFCNIDMKNKSPFYQNFKPLKNLNSLQQAYSNFLFGFSSSFLIKELKESNHSCTDNLKKYVTQFIQK